MILLSGSFATAIIMGLLWIPVALRWMMPDFLSLLFIFGGFVLTPAGSLLAGVVLARSQGKSRAARVALAANLGLLLLHLATVRGFYTA